MMWPSVQSSTTWKLIALWWIDVQGESKKKKSRLGLDNDKKYIILSHNTHLCQWIQTIELNLLFNSHSEKLWFAHLWEAFRLYRIWHVIYNTKMRKSFSGLFIDDIIIISITLQDENSMLM